MNNSEPMAENAKYKENTFILSFSPNPTERYAANSINRMQPIAFGRLYQDGVTMLPRSQRKKYRQD